MAEVISYKCPFCGGGVEFEASAQKMKCPFCDSVFGREDVLAMEEKQGVSAEENLDGTDGEETDFYVCSACGGEIVAGPETVASRCPYCDNPVVLGGRTKGKWKPDLIIPFRVTKRAAVEVMKRFADGKALAPKYFRDENHLEEIKSVYVPFWIYDAGYSADVTYRATSVRRWSTRKYNYTETSYYRVERAGSLAFRNVPVDASVRMPDDMMDSLEPFRLEDAVEFRTAYLSGHMADKYDVSAEICMNRAHTRMQNTARRVFRDTVKGYNTVSVEKEAFRYRDISPRYALLPVWLLRTEWQGKKYTFAMNGQTGKFVGELPMDTKVYWERRLLYGGIISLLLFLPALLFLSVFSLLALPVILAVGFFMGELPLLGDKRAIRNVEQKKTAFEYTGNEDLRLARAEDVFLNKTTTRQRRDD